MKSAKSLLLLMPLLISAAFLPARAADVSSVPMTAKEAAFAAEPVDVQWSAQKKKEIEDSLSGVSSPAIECKSVTCRVTLTWTSLAGDETWEQFRQRTAKWTEEVGRKGGFVRADMSASPNNPTTVSYFSMQHSRGRLLPPSLSQEAEDAFQKCLRESAERHRQQVAAGSATSSVSTCIL